MNLRPECVLKECINWRFQSEVVSGMVMASYICRVTGDERTILYPAHSEFACPFYKNRRAAEQVPARAAH